MTGFNRKERRLGVAARLTGALIGLTALTLLAALLALYGSDRFRRGFDQIALDDVSRLTAVSKLAQRSEAIAVTAPRLIASRDRFELAHQHQFMLDQLGLLDMALADLRGDHTDAVPADEMAEHRDAMTRNLLRLHEVLVGRMALERSLDETLARLDTVADRREARRRHLLAELREGLPQGHAAAELEVLDAQDRAADALLRSLAVRQSSGLRALEAVVRRNLERVVPDLASVAPNRRSDLEQAQAAITELAFGPTGILGLRREQLRVDGVVQGVLLRNNVLVGRFTSSVSKRFSEVESDIDQRRDAFSRLIDGGSTLLVLVGVLAVVGALAIMFYLRRSVIRRLQQLQECMQAGARGERRPIPTEEGGDEIADMGKILAFFIEEIAHREDALTQARDEADRASRAKGDFLANMSHEIRTPMNAIIGFTGLALRNAEDLRQRDHLTKIQTASRSLLGIINDILDFSKIEAGKLEMERLDFAVTDVLDEVASLVMGRAEDKGLEVVFAVDPEVPPALKGDPLRLGQILVNLCTNAIKFTDAGEVVVRCDLDRRNDQSVTLRFSVRDTGVGLSEEQITRLFQPFTQADASTSRNYGGTGLGLSISRRLVEMMGGRIWAEGTPGLGSTFIFTARLERVAPRPSQPARWDALRGARVLVVDDNATARATVIEMLRHFDCRVTEATDGQAALAELDRARAAAEEPYRITLMDWRMPGMNGIEAARRIKADTDLSGLVVVMVTAYSRDEVLAASPSVDGLLIKPVNPSLLFDTMMTLLDGGRGGAPAPSASRPVVEGLRGRHVLLVEDNKVNQEVALELLGHWGVTADVANDGREALLALREAGPDAYDAVLMDLRMPVMGGLEATAAIRNDPAFATLPIIAMTAHAMSDERQRCLEAGMNDHVAKPIEPDRLYEVLVTATAGRGTARPARHKAVPKLAATPDEPLPKLAGVDEAAGLRRVAGNRRLYLKLLRDFCDQWGDAATRLDAAMKAGEARQAEEIAHTLKGVAGNVGASDVYAQAQALEKALRLGRLDDALTATQGLEAALAVACGGIGRLQSTPPSPPAVATGRDTSTAQRLTARLTGLLEANDLDAGHCFAELRGALGGLHAELVDELGARIDDLDYVGAGETLTRLSKNLSER